MSFFGSLLGTDASKASNAAAADTYSKQKKAISGYNTVGDEYAADYGDLAKKFEPYAAAGGSALEQLMSGLGLSGDGGASFTSAYRAQPGYQSGLDTGIHAVDSSANAAHMGQSGRAMKELYRFGSDYEDKRSGDWLSRLMGLVGVGQQATGQEVGTAGTGLTGRLQQRGTAFGGQLKAADTIGLGQVAGANAEQSALTNLMSMGAKLGGAFLGGGF